MAAEAKRLKPGIYSISNRLQLPTVNNVIDIKYPRFASNSENGGDEKLPVMYKPGPIRNPAWVVTESDDGSYSLQLEGYDAVAQDNLLFGEKGGKMTWKINPQKNDREIPFDLYTVESVSEPGAGWFLDTDEPNENTQVSCGPLLYLPVEPKEYATNALWFFIEDIEKLPVAI